MRIGINLAWFFTLLVPAALSQTTDILAKAEGDVPRTRTEFRRMLQSLLADRFQLRFHRETRELSVCFWVVGKNKPTFRETPSGATLRAMHGVDGRKQTLDLSLASMDMLAKELNSYFCVGDFTSKSTQPTIRMYSRTG